jgi:hypothetical protein
MPEEAFAVNNPVNFVEAETDILVVLEGTALGEMEMLPPTPTEEEG